MESPAQSIYRSDLLKIQKFMGKRKSDMSESVRKLLFTCVTSGSILGVVVLVAIFLPQRLVEKIVGTLLGIVLLTGSILILLPLIAFIVTLIRLIKLLPRFLLPIKLISCPTCHTKHDLFKNSTQFVCPECETVLLFNQTTPATDGGQLLPLSCFSCHKKVAMTKDHGQFECANCGAHAVMTGNTLIADKYLSACPHCQERIPNNARFCSHCAASFTQTCVPVTKQFVDYFLTSGFEELSAVSATTRASAETLLCMDPRGILADATARINLAVNQLPQSDRKFLESYFSSGDVVFIYIQLSYCLEESNLVERVMGVLREADIMHAKALDLLATHLRKNRMLRIDVMRKIESGLSEREKVLEKLRSIRKEIPFKTAKINFGTFPKNATKGEVWNPGFVIETAKDLSSDTESLRAAPSDTAPPNKSFEPTAN